MKNKKILLPLTALVVLGALFAVLEITHVTNFIKSQPKTTGTSQSASDQKKQEADADAETKRELIEGQTTAGTSNSTSSSTKTIDLTAKQETNNTVTVFTKLYGYSSGTCALVVTNGSKTTSQTAAFMYQPEYSSCAGFSVPIDPLGKGNWSITLTVTSNGKTDTKTINTEVK